MLWFLLGLLTSLTIGVAARVILGLRLNLYLVSEEGLRHSKVLDQSVIPVTSESRREKWWKLLRGGKWREDIELTLTDGDGNPHPFLFGYDLLRRFYFAPVVEGRPGPARFLSSGEPFDVGGRKFSILISSKRLGRIAREFELRG